MALTFPLALADFFDGLKIQSAVLDLGEALQTEETGGGEIITADIGNRLWRMEIELPPLPYDQAEEMIARIETLRLAGRSLLVYPIPRRAPQSDPNGIILGGSTVQINSLNGNNRELTLKGLPNAYALKAGDMIGWQYGSSPTRYALHKLMSSGTANGSGVTGSIEIAPHIKAGAAVNTVVTLIKPLMKAVYVPGSFKPGRVQGMRRSGIGFTVIQTYR
jgi:hypothetical protein